MTYEYKFLGFGSDDPIDIKLSEHGAAGWEVAHQNTVVKSAYLFHFFTFRREIPVEKTPAPPRPTQNWWRRRGWWYAHILKQIQEHVSSGILDVDDPHTYPNDSQAGMIVGILSTYDDGKCFNEGFRYRLEHPPMDYYDTHIPKEWYDGDGRTP